MHAVHCIVCHLTIYLLELSSGRPSSQQIGRWAGGWIPTDGSVPLSAASSGVGAGLLAANESSGGDELGPVTGCFFLTIALPGASAGAPAPPHERG